MRRHSNLEFADHSVANKNYIDDARNDLQLRDKFDMHMAWLSDINKLIQRYHDFKLDCDIDFMFITLESLYELLTPKINLATRFMPEINKKKELYDCMIIRNIEWLRRNHKKYRKTLPNGTTIMFQDRYDKILETMSDTFILIEKKLDFEKMLRREKNVDFGNAVMMGDPDKM